MNDWLTVAENLPLSQSCRINCVCGNDKSAIVTNDITHYRVHCFRCGINKFEKKTYVKLTVQEEVVCPKNNLPQNYTATLPDQTVIWLWQRNIPPSLAKKYSIGWDSQSNRLIIPVLDENRTLCQWIARDITGKAKIKSINAAGRREIFYSMNSAQSSKVILVEDFASAMVVGEIHPCWALNGSSPTQNIITKLAEKKQIILWLDPDRAGKLGALKIKQRCSFTDVHVILTDKDPKYYSKPDIEEILHALA